MNKTLSEAYCNSLFNYSRFKTRAVSIGEIGIGGHHPIRVQSMTTTDTMDTQATVAQSIRMIEAGCELVRITAPSIKEAQNLEVIKKELRAAGFNTPLVADIHFTPNAAELAARLVEKVRVNPGNYADKKKFEQIDYTDASYQAELDRIRERFLPLVKICKEYGTAMRIGTNHGSLSDRILSRYGDTPQGMVESAMEFLHICRDENYHEIVLSMKASNPQVMVQAYRLLVNRMIQEGMNYPLHLGVTEAGDGLDGRIKSAVGIGTLLEDGLGDTIRVSLTEEPEFEIPVAKALAERYNQRHQQARIAEVNPIPIDPFSYNRRDAIAVKNLGGEHVPVVIADLSEDDLSKPSALFKVGYHYSVPLDKWNITDFACDYVYVGKKSIDFEIPGTLHIIQDVANYEANKDSHVPLFKIDELGQYDINKEINFLQVDVDQAEDTLFHKIKSLAPHFVLLISSKNILNIHAIREFVMRAINMEIKNPVVIKLNYSGLSEDLFQLFSSTDAGALLVDGIGDGLMISNGHSSSQIKEANFTTFGILQATRTRISKTEYISCPSCGRTLFDLQETTAKIRAKTNHLKGVKIGIMGCIVNGPGEMADADFGYVGTGVGKITLYKGKEVVKRNVNSEHAVDELIQLIKDHGRWVDAS
ncbi:MAG: (E)-4-hydroxy-3-methylbut-2-enyl-diphosphate synthase [Flavobacteriales bacterium]